MEVRTRAARTSLLGLLTCASALAAAPDKFLVVLDPGHGGEDAGGYHRHDGRRVAEKDITLAIALETARVLRARGIHALLTRYNDSTVRLDERAELANQASRGAKESVFLSIHANSSTEHSSSGVETYVFNATTNEASRRLAEIENARGGEGSGASNTLDLILTDLAATANSGESRKLAAVIQESVVTGLRRKNYGVRNRGIRQAQFYVLMRARMPGILFEPGFASNPEEVARLTDKRFQNALAMELAAGLMKWRGFKIR